MENRLFLLLMLSLYQQRKYLKYAANILFEGRGLKPMRMAVIGGMSVFHLLCQVELMVFYTETWRLPYVLWGKGAFASPRVWKRKIERDRSAHGGK